MAQSRITNTSCIVRFAILSAISTFASSALGSGFQLFEGNAVNVGDFGAGGAAIAEDASTAFFNPAGLVRIENQQGVVASTGISTHVEVTGDYMFSLATPQPPIMGVTESTLSGVTHGGGFNVVPASHYAAPINDRTFFGFSLTVPFGLATNYPETAYARYTATKSEVLTTDLSPSLGVKVSDQFSVGAGFDAEYLKAQLHSVAGAPVLAVTPPPLMPRDFDYTVKNDGDDWGYGWHAGLLYQISSGTRIGANYHSKVDHHLKGNSVVTGIGALNIGMQFVSRVLTADVTLPATTTISIYHEINPQVSIMGTANYTQWNVIKTLVLNNVATRFSGVTVTVTDNFNFRNTWRVAMGANWHVNKKLMLRCGGGYDQTPTVDAERALRLPDANRIYVAVGTHYQANPQFGLDLGYTHIFLQDVNLNKDVITTTQVSNLMGEAVASTDLFGGQVTWNFA